MRLTNRDDRYSTKFSSTRLGLFTYFDCTDEHFVPVRIKGSQIADDFEGFASDFWILLSLEEVEENFEECGILDIRFNYVASIFHQMPQCPQGNFSFR